MMWRTVFLLIFIMGCYRGAHAQYISQHGGFEVDQIRGCEGLTVTVTPIDPFLCDSDNPCAAFYENDVDNEPLINPPFTHTYSQPGVYTLKILRAATYDSIKIEVLPKIVPVFEVYRCSNYSVTVKINDSNYDEYVINYNDGSPEVIVGPLATHQHTYASATTRTITVRGRDLNTADNCGEGGKIVTPVQSLPPPTITLLEVLDTERIRIAFDGQSNVQYKLGVATNNGTTFQQAKTLYNTTVDTISNLRTDENYYCFQVAALDPCTNQVLNSATICSTDFDVSVRNNAIDTRWTTATAGISNYTLTRTASDGAVLVTNPGASPYSDGGVTCGIEYCYQLTTNYPNGSRSVSLSKCETGFSTDTPPAIENITAKVADVSVVLDWETDPNFNPAEFFIDKSVNDHYAFLASTAQHAYADGTYVMDESSCYRIRYRDICGNESPLSAEACPLALVGVLQDDNSIALSWNPYSGWAQGVSGYTVEKYTEDGTLLQTFQTGGTTYVDASDDLDHQVFTYVVKAEPLESGLGKAESNKVSILKDPNLFHPTAFTPNGDNLNDNFTVFGQYVAGFEMKIFNRWGELMFTTDDITAGWDGTFRGAEMPEGTYTFIAHITDRAGRTFKRSGSVLLLRK